MTLNFPNLSRSYDETRQGIRFWGYDDALEIPFFLERDALFRLSPRATLDEPAFLAAFDANLTAIQRVAARVYTRYAKGSYILAAADF